MKNEAIPRLRFRRFHNRWRKVSIRDMFKITRGHVLSKSNISKSKDVLNKYPVYSSQTKNNGLLGYYTKYLYKNAITWTTDGANAGTVRFHRGKFYSTNVNGVLLSNRGYDNEAISNAINLVAFKYVSRVGNPKLMNNVMATIPIKVTSLSEQCQISKFFAKLNKLIQLQQKKVSLLKKLKRGYLQKLFPRKGESVPRLRFKGFHDKWGRKSLLDITNLYNGQSYKRHDKNLINKGTFVIRASNIQHGQIIHNNDDVYINSNVVNVNNIKPGDIIIVTNNGSRHLIGKHAMVTHVYPNTVIGAFMNAFRSKNNCYFINALLNSNEFLRDVHKSLGGIINNLSKSDFRLMFLTIPLLKEQVYIGNFFKKLDRGIILQRNKLAYLRKLKKAYLQKMFC